VSDTLTTVVSSKDAGQRCDRFMINTWPQFSRAQIQRWLETGAITVNGASMKASHKMHEGDRVLLTPPEMAPSELIAENIPLTILFEDRDLIVVNKSPDMVVHPGAGQTSGTLVHALLGHCKDLRGVGDQERPGIVHRLDKGTSGVIIVAKSDESHRALQTQFQTRQVVKEYMAVLQGIPKGRAGVWDKPIGRHPVHRQKMAVTQKGRASLTRWECVETFGRFASLVHLFLHTGRTHQIRVHAAHAGHPLIGDATYSAGRAKIGPEEWRKIVSEFTRPALHAFRLQIAHPRTGETMEWTAPIPDDMQNLILAARAHVEEGND